MLLSEVDLNHRSYLSNTYLTDMPICPHSPLGDFSFGIAQKKVNNKGEILMRKGGGKVGNHKKITPCCYLRERLLIVDRLFIHSTRHYYALSVISCGGGSWTHNWTAPFSWLWAKDVTITLLHNNLVEPRGFEPLKPPKEASYLLLAMTNKSSLSFKWI